MSAGMNAVVKPSPLHQPLRGQRELDEVRQIAVGHGGKVISRHIGGARHQVSVTVMLDPEAPAVRTMMRAIEFAIRGQFDRGRRYPGMTQFTGRSRLVDVMIRCLG